MKPDETRKFFEARPNQWIPVKTPETIASIRELRTQGHPFTLRFKDGRREASWQGLGRSLVELATEMFDVVPPAALCEHPAESRVRRGITIACMACGEVIRDLGHDAGTLTPGMLGRQNPLKRTEAGTYEVSAQTCPECGEEFLVRDEHITKSARHGEWLAGHLGTEIPVPQQQPVYKFPLDTPLAVIRFGAVLTCPRCHGRFRKERTDRKTGRTLPAEDFSRDPGDSDVRCVRCNGWGIVPNGGPVPSDSEVTDVDRRIAAERRAAERAKYVPSPGQVGIDDGGSAGAAGGTGGERPARPRKPRSHRPVRSIPDPLARPADAGEGGQGGDQVDGPPGSTGA